MKKNMTFKEFFEKAKYHKPMQSIIIQCFITATRMGVKAGKSIDVGYIVLDAISDMAEILSGIELTEKHEITAKYMAETLNYYSANQEIRSIKICEEEAVIGNERSCTGG